MIAWICFCRNLHIIWIILRVCLVNIIRNLQLSCVLILLGSNPIWSTCSIISTILGDERLPETGIIHTVEYLHGILSSTDVRELTTTGDITFATCYILIDRRIVEMELVAEASMRAGTIIRELCSKHHLTDILIGTIRLCIIPQFLEVLTQRVSSNYLLAILDDSIQVSILVLGIPAIMQF